MKAFSFPAILKNFGKQLSSLASPMPWCNLRFNLGSMSVLSRVSRPFSRTSLSSSRRASHFAAMIFAVLTLSIANIGMAWGVDYKPYLAEGFEGSTTLTPNSCTANNTTATANATSRTGSKVCYAYPSSASSSARYVGVGSYKTADENWYIHAIVWVKADNVASGKVQHQIGPYGTSPATDYVNTTTSYTRCTIKPLKSGGSAKQIRLYFLSNNSTPVAHFWYDDFIMYLSSENVDTDLTKPSSATSASATTSSISWTNGSDTGDGATGIQATLIFHRTGGSVGGNDLTLNDQGIYSLTATEGPTVVGNWTLLSASVDAAATSYSGTFEAGHEYAIVHRDLAYNYSTPTYVTVADAPSCTAPTSVTVTPTNEFGWRYSIGETISLTATAIGGSGNYTYQWQKYIEDTWTNIDGATAATYTKTNCTTGDGGSYRCKVSTGDGCDTYSEGYFVRVFTLNGGTTNGEWTAHKIVWTSENTGLVTLSLPVSETYYFKVTDNDGKWFGYGDASNYIIQPWQADCGTGNSNIRLFTGPAGDYKFTINIEHAQENSPYVNIKVDYPEVTHPVEGYAYINKWWNCYVHYWEGESNALTAWGSDPKINDDRYVNICGTDYWYFPVIETYTNFIAKDNAGDPANTTGDQSTTNHSGQNITHNGSAWVWQEFSTYSITFDGNGNTGGSMTDVTGIACGGSATLTQNAFTRTGYTFAGWATTADGDVAHADKATISNITSNITLYAKWTPETYNISYYEAVGEVNDISGLNEISIDGAPTSYTILDAVALPSLPTKEGYTATGWYTKWCVFEDTENTQSWAGCGTTTGHDAGYYRHANYIVKYTPDSYTITWNANGGNVTPESSTYTYDGSAVELPTPTRDGYTFNGWFTAQEGGTQITEIGTTNKPTSNVTYYAQWTENTPAPAGDCGEIIKSTFGGTKNTSSIPSTTTFNTTGEIGGTSTSAIIGDNGKLNNEGAYLILKLSTGTFLAGDTIKISSDESGGVKFATGTVSTKTYTLIGTASTATSGGQPYYFVLDANADSIIVPRGSKSSDYNQNPEITYVSVHRPCPECDATPSAPTAFSAGSITSTGATFTITDAANTNNYEIYYSTSDTAPTAETEATTTSTENTKAVTGLTASTTYYAWVRSVCDASHKSDWVALGTTSFTTSAAEPTALVTWQMKVDQAAWALKSGTTEDGTNITSIASTADEPGSTSTGITGTTGKVVMASGESNVDKAASFTFTVNSAKKVVPEKVTCKVLNVSSGNRTYKAQLSDNNGHVYYSTNTVSVTTENVLTDATFNFASSLVLTGNVTLKVYAWKTSGSPTQFRMGEYVKLFGTVDDYNCTALNLTRGGQENGTYTVGNYTGNPLTCTVNAGEPASYQWKQYTLGQGEGEAVNAVGSGSTTTSFTPNPASANTYYYACEVTDICGNTLITPYTGTFVFNTAVTYSVTHSLTNVTATSGATGAGAATEGVAYNAVFAASSGYVLPSTITVTIGSSPATAGTGYTWNSSTGAFQVPAAQVTGDIVITIAGETAPATKDIYYGHVKITDGALVREIPSGATQFFTNIGGTVANNTEISLSSTPSTTDMYYNSNNLTDAELSKSSNWGTSSGSNRYIRGLKFGSGKTYELQLGDKIATSIFFYGWCGSASKTLTIDSTVYTSPSTKEEFFSNEFTQSGNYTGDVSIVCGGDFYGIIVIETAALDFCTTPELPTLTAQTVCPGEPTVTWTGTNTEPLEDDETITYQWTKKGNATVLSTTETLTLSSITEAAGGTYVVTATVSAEGKASATATKEVTLTVTPATATPTITASASTVYVGNSVTLTAACASTGVTYQWYTCTDADGNGESEIGEAENAEYTLTAGEAGTYYYKVIVTGDGTHSCGTAERVYTLTVSEASGGDCETEFWFAKAADKPDGATAATHISGTPSGSSSASYTATIDGNNYTITGSTGQKTGNVTITVPEDYEGTLYAVVQGSGSRTITLSKGGEQVGQETPSSGVWGTFAFDNLDAGTYTLVSSGNIGWGFLALKLCSAEDCSDPEVTASADNTTACVGTSVTFTATNYADGATFQWQKLDGTWTDISEATSATYTISSVTTEHAGQYRVIATNECSRTSEELTLTVLTAPEFNTFATTASVMKGNALSINDVEATNATDYTWYKSTDNSFDAADTKVGTSQDLLLAAASIPETAGQTFYLFCVASNSCGSVTSNAITVTVTPFVEEECATAGNEGSEHEFGFTNTSCSKETYGDSKTPVWKTSSRSKYLTYTAPEGRYFATAKVTVAHTGGTKCGYAYSTNGGTTWEVAELDGLSTTLTAITIELPANVTAFRISRNLTAQDGEKGSDSGNFYLYEACFTYENACTETTLTPDQETITYNITDGGDFTKPTFTLKAGENTLTEQTLTYTSSNPAIATVDEDGGVTFEGMTGTVTITATFAGATIDEIEYCASEGSYTITVVCEDEEPKIIAAAGTNLDGCNKSITLEAKMQDGTTSFIGGTYQWYRDGEAIEGATSASYEVVRAGTYTVSRTDACTKMSSNSAVVTNENPEPKVERLTPFQYYHVNKTYSNQMKDRHLFAVTSYGTSDGKRYHLTATRNGETLDLSSSTAFFTIPSSDNAVDTVMIDLNELKNKYAEKDEIVITCAPINNCNQVSAITSSITIHVIDQTPTLALICSGSSKAGGTRKTGELTVGGDFLTGYNVADLCRQTGNTSFDANTEWGFYTELQKEYRVTPVNGYAPFNKLNYEPFDILLLTDYPKASKSDAAATILDDMAELCDYRPLLSLKAHMVAKSPSKWAAKGFTTSPVVPAATSQFANIVCYAHPMFDDLDDAQVEGIYHDHDDFNQLVYQILTGPGHESGKGLQGFELKDADNFVTIGLIHYNAAADTVTHTDRDDTHTHLKWTPAANDRQLVAIAERQANIEARMILFAINCGAQSMQTPMGRQVLLTCLDYLLKTDPIEVADCRMTFDNGEGNTNWGESPYEGTGTKGDGLWSTAANWGPDYLVVPGRNNDVRIAAPCTVDANEVEVLSVHITEDGSLTIPADKSLTARSTILRADEHGNVYPTNVEDISLGSNAGGNASLILNNERGDTKAGVAMYSTAEADTESYSAAASTWQYIGTPHSDVANAIYNYYDSWLYQYDTETQGWAVIPNGGPLVPFRGYCVTHPESPHTYWMEGTLVSTTNQDISIPANRFVVVANSWTAPIQINELTDDDMEGLTDKTIYFFNTGSDPNQAGELNQENGRYAAGTYVSVPIHSAPYTGDSYIPSMQGFYVVGGNADGTLHLDYERHVRAKRENVPSGPMHAPARITDTDNEPQVAKFLFRGTRYDDRLIILERPDFTRGYDSGWDGEQWGGNAAAPMSYVVTETRWDAVSAIPEYEGTVIAFRAGEDSEYTIHFDYDGMEEALYLLDTDTQIYTRVLKGNSYTFTCTDKAEHNRFILTRKAPQIATGTENINTGENAKAVKFIKDDKIFIFVNGILYDATGKMVIR